MNFDLSQLLQGPVRELVLNQVTKQFGINDQAGGSLLTKGLSMVLGGMTQKASSTEGAKGLFDLIKTTNLQGNPLDALMGKTDLNVGNLLEMGKDILPSLFGNRTDAVSEHLANSAGTSAFAAKGVLGMLLPVVFSFFKNKILSGVGVSGFANLLADQTKSVASHLDSGSLAALGFANKSLGDVLGNVAKVGATAGAAAAATSAAASSAHYQPTSAKPAKSSGFGKWLLAGAVLLAALFGIKSCSDNKATQAAPATETAPASPAAETVKVSEGLGDLAWTKTDKDLTVSGTVQNEGVKASILDAFKGLAAGLPLVDKLVVDAKADQFSFNNFAGLANLFKEFPGVNGSFADKVLNLFGEVNSDDAKASLVEKAKALLGNVFSVNADKVTVNEPEAAPIADMSLDKLDLDIIFKTGSAEINPRYYRRLNALAQYLAEHKRHGEIAGHTDNVGDAAANQKLSEQRAIAVRDYLIKQGMPADALTAVGYGQDDPVADNNTEEGRTKNRRIEFNVR